MAGILWLVGAKLAEMWGASQNAPPDLRYEVWTVAPEAMIKFKEDHPDALPATTFYEYLTRKDPDAAERLRQRIKQLAYESPNHLIVCCNIR